MTVPLSPSPSLSPQQQYPRSPSYSPSPQQQQQYPHSPSYLPSPQQQQDSPQGDDGGSTSVRVAVRARPLVEKELVEGCTECVSEDGKQVVLGKDRRFTFDHVFGPGVSQEEVYNDCVKPLVESCCGGYNATVLAYGQTGSGKTFTMGCGNNVPLLEEELGILPRAIRQLFECVEERSNQAEFLIRCAYVEIYNEEIKDLLHPETPIKSISIREDASGNIILAGVKEEVVTNFESMIKFLEDGSVHRTTGSTLMNQHSSRSHAIFTIIVEQRSILECASTSEVITAKFHLVDLAGSERAKRTGAVGMRFRESVTINCGLLALGNVISALGDEQKRCQHVPYRESKLTRMLQDSLGGNSRTCMIACVSTADLNYEETLNTLKYANRARNIRNKPVINRDPHSALLSQLRQEIRALQMELLNSRMRNIGLEPVTGPKSSEILLQDETQQVLLADIRARQDTSVDVTAEIDSVRRKNREKEHECLKLKDEIQELQSLVGRLEEEMSEVCIERDNYQRKLDEVNSEMAALVQVLPHWEDVSPATKSHLHEMMKRVTGEIESELGPCSTTSSESSFSSVDRPNGFIHRRGGDKERSGRGSPLSERGSPRKTSRGRAALQEDFLPSSPRGSPSRADLAARGCNSPGGTTRATRNIINQHLRTIRVLEERLAVKESDAKSKEEALKEATEDLVRDERIFAEKMNEIKTLKQLARDLTTEKEILVRKAEKDTVIISRMSEDALAKEDELSRLRTSLGMSGCPDAFVINGARVPKCVSEDVLAEEDDLGRLRTSSLGMSRGPDAFVVNGDCVPKCVSEDALAEEDDLGRLRTSLGMSGCPDAFVINGVCVPGVPVALIKPKAENEDWPTDNNENPDEVMAMSLKNVPRVPVAIIKPKAENEDRPTDNNNENPDETKLHALDDDSDATAAYTVGQTHPEDLSEETKVCLFSTTAADTVGQTHPEDLSEKMMAEEEKETEKALPLEKTAFILRKPCLEKDVEEVQTGKNSKRRKQKSGFFSKCLSGF